MINVLIRIIQMKKVLICGATGFIGSNILNSLNKNKNYKIFALIHKKKPKKKIKNVSYLYGDLLKYNDCLKITKGIDTVIQCAATTSGSKDIINKPYLHVTDNAIMNSYILRAIYENKIKHFIFTSCTVMYKNSNNGLKENEVDEKKIFHNYYGVANTKLYVEKICKFYASISKTKFSIIRHSNIYGYNDKFDLNKGHFIGSSICKIFKKNNNDVKIFGKGNEKRDFLFIDDFIIFLKLLLVKQKNNYEIFNCSYGKSFSIKDILKKMIEISNVKKDIYNIKNSTNINVNICVSSEKAKKVLGWRPKFTIDQGLKKTINWYVKNEKFL